MQPDPLQYLLAPERLVCGWMVARMFATNTSRFAHNVQKYGVKSTAISSCARVLNFYAGILVVVGVAANLAHAPTAGNVAYGLAGLCVLWGVPRAISAWRLQRQFVQDARE
jgi:hypothetical protein